MIFITIGTIKVKEYTYKYHFSARCPSLARNRKLGTKIIGLYEPPLTHIPCIRCDPKFFKNP